MYYGIAASAALSVRRSRHRPPLRHTGLTALPLAASRPAPSARAPAAQAPAARAFGAYGSAVSVSRPIYRVLCRVYIPLSTSPILLSLFSALPLSVQREARAGDVMAGAGGAAGPAPDVRHQPAGDVPSEFPEQLSYTLSNPYWHQHLWLSGLKSFAVCMRFTVQIP